MATRRWRLLPPLASDVLLWLEGFSGAHRMLAEVVIECLAAAWRVTRRRVIDGRADHRCRSAVTRVTSALGTRNRLAASRVSWSMSTSRRPSKSCVDRIAASRDGDPRALSVKKFTPLRRSSCASKRVKQPNLSGARRSRSRRPENNKVRPVPSRRHSSRSDCWAFYSSDMLKFVAGACQQSEVPGHIGRVGVSG